MRAGFYETEIVPPLGTTIFGYPRKRVNSGVTLKLYAKAVVVESEGKKAALLVLDCGGLPKDLPEKVIERVCSMSDIERDSILLAATHAHTSGPYHRGLGSFVHKPRLEGEPLLDAELDDKAIDMTILKAADAIILANQRLEEVHIKFAMGAAKDISYVREYYINDGTIRTNPGYCKDDIVKPYSEPETDLPVFFFTDKEGRPKGAITSFALHHDTVSGCEMSSDFSGVVARNMKRLFGDEFITLFFAGFCGNINHLDFMGEKQGKPFKKTAEEIGGVLTRELLQALTEAEPLADDSLCIKKELMAIPKRKLPDGLLERVKELKKNPPTTNRCTIAEPYGDGMLYAHAQSVLNDYEKDTRTVYDIPVMVVKLGDCMLYSFVGEMFSQFADKIRANSPSKKNLMIELSNSSDPSPYIPIPELYDVPTVYEASIYEDSLVKEAGDMMVDRALELAKEMYQEGNHYARRIL
ncbi:MAG: neutral/alkaline non-lysosomal ceramidase N-terminal domain-containing protein [Clostridia bacterium]|nr:neutral/alkaline non-lysosomal ceramidase N-terminal domain-containing protein [Clostridia bacterium]